MTAPTGSPHPERGTRSAEALDPGVSVVVPTLGGRRRLPRCLDSLLAQDVPAECFEIIVVVNGPDDGTGAYVDDVRRNAAHRVRVIRSDRSGAGRARNLGVAAARFAHVTFVDDDDTVGPRFVSTLLALTEDGVIPAVPLVDVVVGEGEGEGEGGGDGDGDGDGRTVASAVSDQIARHAGRLVAPAEVPSLLACNAAKLVPTPLARRHPYPPDLRSGEDVVFFGRLVTEQRLQVHVAAEPTGAEYRRHLRRGSVSRRVEPDWAFAVEQRLAVLRHLDALADRADPDQRRLLDVFLIGQTDFMRRYVLQHPDERDAVIDAIEAAELRHFPYERFNHGAARELVVSYCFPPDLDTSGIVAAKRVQQAGRVVDVISNRMSRHRTTDPGALRIAAAQIERHVITETHAEFNSWASITAFCRSGLAAWDTLARDRQPYESMYSRALWPGSHVLAGLIKARQPTIRWRAEYSDPMSHDIWGRRRPDPHGDDEIIDELTHAAARAGHALPRHLEMFALVEALPMALADELVFTNTQQREVMLGYAPTSDLRQRAAEIATVAPHPTLPERFYQLEPLSYPLDPSHVHLAYFGAFYASRSLDDVLDAIAALEPARRDRVRLHVFTSQPHRFLQIARERGIEGAVVARSLVPFLGFLNLCTQFDVLVLSDTETSASHSVSPYLPSKWSDYRGGGRPVWAILEPGSPLSREQLAHRSTLGDAASCRATLEQIIAATLPSRAHSA